MEDCSGYFCRWRIHATCSFLYSQSGERIRLVSKILRNTFFQRVEEAEKQRKLTAGKARIGGDWELQNTDGKLEGSEQLKYV